jgi:RimJ/RimL family protein N-acetyltransferase
MPMRPAITHPELLDAADSLDGASFLLRSYRPGDGEALFAGIDAHRDELQQRLPWPDTHRTVADSEAYARRMQADFVARRQFVFGIWHRASGEYLGGTSLHALDWRTPKAEVGYFLLPPARGRGHATVAVRLLVRLGFERLKLNRLHATCDASNAPSAAVLRRAGLREEGRSRLDQRDHHGRLRDTLHFALTIDDYPDWSAAAAA